MLKFWNNFTIADCVFFFLQKQNNTKEQNTHTQRCKSLIIYDSLKKVWDIPVKKIKI